MTEVLPLTAAVLLVAFALLWALSVALRDASIVDVFWGPGFALVAWTAFLQGDGAGPRPWLAAGLTTLWGLRLGGYLLWRNAGHGEDRRYRAMRRHHGARFVWVSAVTVFGLQGVLMWIVSLPVQAAATSRGGLGVLDALGVLLFGAGLLFESVGDWQLARFKADPANRGRVLDRGLWAWTRHPNYFGDFLLWWGLFALAAAAGSWWTAVGPVAMSVLLMRVSGVTLLERGLARSKEGWSDYAARVPAFFPRPPGSRAMRHTPSA